MKSKIILATAAFIASNALALEITNYSTQAGGTLHNVTVAFDDLDNSAEVRCVIKKLGKPVGMKDKVLNGVGTMVIRIDGGIDSDTSVECLTLP